MKRFFRWVAERFAPEKPAPRLDPSGTGAFTRKPGAHRGPPQARAGRPAPPESGPEIVELDPHFDGEVVDNGPGKNVLIRNRLVREDTGTHDTLTILDDSMLDTEEEAGIDPYNTGQFDRSKNWDKRFRN
ncbi:MAG: hypothetical protein KJO82_02665 [Gammaproteobacteria bacterium]|nr:hypothetical protein [Gammaproteobacteria bacterium]